MKVQILDKSDTELNFVLEESNPQFANAIRRIAIGEIPILAIDSVDFTQNDSVLYNEVIAHRLALIPLIFDHKDFHFRSEHEGNKTCARCEVVFAIDKKGPSTVYSRDMKSSNKDVKPLHDNIPIVELHEGQRLKLEATAILGFGKDHAKWQASNSSYKYHESNGKVDKTKFVFNIESVSGLKPEEIVLVSIETLKKKTKEFEKQLDKIK